MPFKKGEVSNPNGRPRSPEVELFRQAKATVEKKMKVSLYEHAITQAYKDNTVLVQIVRKFIPDKIDEAGAQGILQIIRHLSDDQLKQDNSVDKPK